MALKFIGERTVGTLNGMKSGFVKDDLYRIYDAGILVPGGVAVEHGDFVSWDGTEWVKEASIKIVNTSNLNPDSVPESASESNPLVTEQDMKDMEEMFLVNLPCAAKTLRFEFSKMDYDPTVAGVGSSGTWKKVNAKFHNVWEWTKSGTSFSNAFEEAFKSSDNLVSVIAAGDTSAITNMYHMFYECSSLISVTLFDTSAVANMQSMFSNCTSLTSVPLFNTSAVTNMSVMFQGCTSLKNAPLFDTSAVTFMYNMFYGCTSLKNVPLFDTSKVTNIGAIFQSCGKVEGGALALYQQASAQETPPASHNNAFKDCGKDTETGAAELAQIPASWGGTAAG